MAGHALCHDLLPKNGRLSVEASEILHCSTARKTEMKQIKFSHTNIAKKKKMCCFSVFYITLFQCSLHFLYLRFDFSIPIPMLMMVWQCICAFSDCVHTNVMFKIHHSIVNLPNEFHEFHLKYNNNIYCLPSSHLAIVNIYGNSINTTNNA